MYSNNNSHGNFGGHGRNNKKNGYNGQFRNRNSSNNQNQSEYSPATKNMNYYFNVEYFKAADEKKIPAETCLKVITNFKFSGTPQLQNFQNDLGAEMLSAFSLYTAYPGLLEGIGNPRGLLESGDKESDSSQIKCGFTFDYTSGIPYIPGSALKGLLRSYFPGCGKEKDVEKEEYICAVVTDAFEKTEGLSSEDAKKKAELLDIEMFEKAVFGSASEDSNDEKADSEGKQDVFLGAYPDISSGKSLMSIDYITPHTQGPYKNPVPIELLKVRPNVRFDFCFILHDHRIHEVVVKKEVLENVFRTIILDMGAGAKTNVGFGRFIPESLDARKEVEVQPKSAGSQGRSGSYGNNNYRRYDSNTRRGNWH